jgi:hypothetical protein
MHRDREVKIEPVVWSTPARNSVLLLSKWLAMTLLSLALVIVGCLTTIVTQLLRGHTPVDLIAYLNINAVTFGGLVAGAFEHAAYIRNPAR